MINADQSCPLRDVLECTKVLYRLYGREVAKKYFTSHVKFDTITLA